MRVVIDKTDDLDEMRRIHAMAFKGDPWPGDDHEFWVAYDEHSNVVGFCSVEMLPAGAAFLSRAAVVKSHLGTGLHRRLIRHRMRWLKKQGCVTVVTYVSQFNYSSMVNLLGAGFRFAPNKWLKGWKQFHLMYRGDPSDARPAFEALAAEG